MASVPLGFAALWMSILILGTPLPFGIYSYPRPTLPPDSQVRGIET